MEIGVGLPSVIPETRPEVILEWARRADAGPFASVAAVDRMIYGSLDPLVTLTAAAAVTQRVRLVTGILIAPLRDALSMAKQAISLDALSGGRLTLGLGIGARGDDYDASEFRGLNRGRRLTDQLVTMNDLWEGASISPSTTRTAPRMLLGGLAGPAFGRMARFGDGYLHNGGPPKAFGKAAALARAAWADNGRSGEPQLWGMAYFALGEKAADAGNKYLLDYYAFTGGFASRIADGLLTTPLEVRNFLNAYVDQGCDHLLLHPAFADPDQVDALADTLP